MFVINVENALFSSCASFFPGLPYGNEIRRREMLGII